MSVRLGLLLSSVLFAVPAQAEWWEIKTDHFVIYSEDDQADSKAFATELERYDHALRSLQTTKFEPIKSDAQRVTIYRTGDIGKIGRLAGSQGVAGFYKPQMYPVSFTPARREMRGDSIIRQDSRTDLDPKSVLFHEYAHHFMFQYFPAGYPSWYVEAFAETAATIDMKPDGSFHLGNPPQWRSDWLFNAMTVVTPKSLLASESKPDGEDYYGYYSFGWLMNQYLTFEPSRRGQLVKYLRLVNSGKTSAEAAREAFGDLDKLNAEISRYKTSRKLLGADVRPGTAFEPSITMRKLAPDEEATMAVQVRSKAGVSRKDAKGVAADARALVARYPSSVAANTALAEAELDAENYTDAVAAADRAMKLDPQAVMPPLFKGAALMEMGRKDKQYLPQARAALAIANANDPIDPAPLFLNYMTYYHSGGAIPENAIIGLEKAYDQARQDRSVRLVLARQLLAEKKGSLAKSIMLPLALNPHESKTQKTLSDIVGMIDAGKVEDAHQKLVKEMDEWERKARSGN